MKIRFCKQNYCDRDTNQPPRQPFVANRYPCRHNLRQKSSKYFSISQYPQIGELLESRICQTSDKLIVPCSISATLSPKSEKSATV